MMRVVHWILVAMLALTTVARAQEEDDDPKAKPAAGAKAKAKPDSKMEPKAKTDPKPEAKAKADPKPEAKAKADPKAEAKKTAGESKTEVTVEKVADEPAPPPKKVKTLPKLARASESVPDAVAQLPESAAPRSVRVRLVDGSTVVGTVRAEQMEALVVDCSLGQLSIPRTRISTIAYDSAAGVGAKRAPVQQLDDDAPPARKRAPANP
jgi:outer membrane biosynthesis protein TonB